ncbi:MAG: hypothetical protein HYR79_10925 [Nitrospirae bacterium]|nr:hypothetical protein [Nitrospirota bacterium]
MDAKGFDETAILKKIQEVEAELEETIQRAQAETGEKVRKAKEEADQLFRKRGESIKAECERWLQNEKSEGEKEAALIFLAAKVEAQDLREQVGSKIEEGSKHVLRGIYPDLSEDLHK